MTRIATTIPATVPLFGTLFEMATTAVAVESPVDDVDVAVW